MIFQLEYFSAEFPLTEEFLSAFSKGLAEGPDPECHRQQQQSKSPQVIRPKLNISSHMVLLCSICIVLYCIGIQGRLNLVELKIFNQILDQDHS